MRRIIHKGYEVLNSLGSPLTRCRASSVQEGYHRDSKHADGVEEASPYWVNAVEVLENDAKRMQWLLMQEAAHLSWMNRQIDKMNWIL